VNGTGKGEGKGGCIPPSRLVCTTPLPLDMYNYQIILKFCYLLTYSSDYCVFSMHFTMDTILFTLEIIEYIIVRDGLVIRNEPYLSW